MTRASMYKGHQITGEYVDPVDPGRSVTRINGMLAVIHMAKYIQYDMTFEDSDRKRTRGRVVA